MYSSFVPWLRVSFSTFCMISNHKLWSILTIDLRIFLNGQFQVQYRFTSTILSSLNFTKYSLRVLVWEKKTVKSFITLHKSKLLVNNCKQILKSIFVRDPMSKKQNVSKKDIFYQFTKEGIWNLYHIMTTITSSKAYKINNEYVLMGDNW